MATTFGDNIRKYRENKGMRQEDLAIALGYKTKGAINKIENNVTKLPQDKIKKCAEILEVPVAQLFSEAEPKKDPYEPYREYLPFLAQANQRTIEAIRVLLGMPESEKNSGCAYIPEEESSVAECSEKYGG